MWEQEKNLILQIPTLKYGFLSNRTVLQNVRKDTDDYQDDEEEEV